MDIKSLTEPGTKEALLKNNAQALKKPESTPEEIKKAGTQFEALLLKQMLSAMWETVPTSGISGSNEEAMYRDMLNEAMAEDIAEKQSIGIKDVIIKDINKTEGR